MELTQQPAGPPEPGVVRDACARSDASGDGGYQVQGAAEGQAHSPQDAPAQAHCQPAAAAGAVAGDG